MFLAYIIDQEKVVDSFSRFRILLQPLNNMIVLWGLIDLFLNKPTIVYHLYAKARDLWSSKSDCILYLAFFLNIQYIFQTLSLFDFI